jgi:hypothetical protein
MGSIPSNDFLFILAASDATYASIYSQNGLINNIAALDVIPHYQSVTGALKTVAEQGRWGNQTKSCGYLYLGLFVRRAIVEALLLEAGHLEDVGALADQGLAPPTADRPVAGLQLLDKGTLVAEAGGRRLGGKSRPRFRYGSLVRLRST